MSPSRIILKIQSIFWLIKALIKRYHTFLFVGFSFGFILFLITTFTASYLNSRIQQQVYVKRVGVIGSYTPTDFPLKIQQLLSFGLTNITSSDEATAGAAINWDIREDGKSYIFHLNHNLRWQDGKNFLAGDINYNLKDAEINIPDDYTVEIKLKEPFSPLPVLLSQPLFRQGLIGLGNYKVNRLETKDNILTDMTIAPLNETSNLKPIKYKFYISEEKALIAYKLGEIDTIEGITSLNPLMGWPVKVERQVKENWYVALFYNMENSFLSQKAVRQALTYALPQISQEYISSPISQYSWAYNPAVKKYISDFNLARKIMSQPEMSSKSAQKQLNISTTFEYENLARQIALSWKNLDVDVSVKVEKDFTEEFQVLLIAQEIPNDPDQYSLWHSTQRKTNISHYKNPRIDKLLEDGRKIIDRQERQKKYFDFQKYLAEDIPAAFLYHPVTYTVSRR